MSHLKLVWPPVLIPAGIVCYRQNELSAASIMTYRQFAVFMN